MAILFIGRKMRSPRIQYHSSPTNRLESILSKGLLLPRSSRDITTFQHSPISTISTADTFDYAAAYNPHGIVFKLTVKPSSRWIKRTIRNMRRGENLIDAVSRWIKEAKTKNYDAIYIEGMQSTVGNQILNPKILTVEDYTNLNNTNIKNATLKRKHLAKIVPIDENFVSSLRKQFLRYMKNINVVHDYDSALEFKKVGNAFAKNFHELFFERFTNKYLKYYLGLNERNVEYWGGRFRKTGWDFYLELAPPLMRADEYHGPRSRYYDYEQEVIKWSNRVKHKARELWKVLKEFIEQYPHYKEYGEPEELSPYVEVLDVQNYSIDGFDVQLKGYGQGGLGDKHPNLLGLAEKGFKQYRKDAQERLPLLLKNPLPFVLRFDTSLDKAGEYQRKFVELYMSAFIGERKDVVSRFVRVVAHEMGHHIWSTYLSRKDQEFWRKAISGDYEQTLDLQKILDNWQGKDTYGLFMQDDYYLSKGDTTTYLQLNTLYHSPAYRHWFERATKKDVEEKIAEGERYLSVPKHPISGYAGKNSEEAFCEAIGYWVAFGEKGIYPIVRSWLATILPTSPIRTANRENNTVQFIRLSDWDDATWKPDFSSGFVDLEPDQGWWGNFPFTKIVHTNSDPITVTMWYEWAESPHGLRDTFTFKGPKNTLVVLDDSEFNELVSAPLNSPIDHPSFSTVEEYLEHNLIDNDVHLLEEDIEHEFDLEDLIQEQLVGATIQNRKGNLYRRALSKDEALVKIVDYLKGIDFGHESESEIKKLENVSTMLAALGIKPTDVDLAVSELSKGNVEEARAYIYGPSGRGSNLGAIKDLQNIITKKARVSSFIKRQASSSSTLAEEIYELIDPIVDWEVYEPNVFAVFFSTIKDRMVSRLIFDSTKQTINEHAKKFGLRTVTDDNDFVYWQSVMGETVELVIVSEGNSFEVYLAVRENIN